jgi:hypothetical protein
VIGNLIVALARHAIFDSRKPMSVALLTSPSFYHTPRISWHISLKRSLSLSVAFTKEDSAETASETLLPDRPVSPHPNLVTAAGLKALEFQLD